MENTAAVFGSPKNMHSADSFKEFEYLADFEFPVACNDLCFSEDKRKLLAVGVYKPSVRLFDMKSSVMKFERHLTNDPLRVLSLEDNAEKFAILRNDKAIELHTKGGLHEQIKVPAQPKNILLNRVSAELYAGGGYGEIYRLSLEQGRFLKSIPCTGANDISLSKSNGILGAVARNSLSFFDSRSKKKIFSRDYNDEVLCVSINDQGLKYVIGTEIGEILEYDIRSPKPFRKIDIGSFVRQVAYHGSILASTSDAISIISDNGTIASISPGFSINTFSADGGIIFVGGESAIIKGYYSEKLGQPPSWIVDATTL